MNTLGLKLEELDQPIFLHSATGYVWVVYVYRSCRITIGGGQLEVNLAILPMNLYDVILGMDLLTK